MNPQDHSPLAGVLYDAIKDSSLSTTQEDNAKLSLEIAAHIREVLSGREIHAINQMIKRRQDERES